MDVLTKCDPYILWKISVWVPGLEKAEKFYSYKYIKQKSCCELSFETKSCVPKLSHMAVIKYNVYEI